MMLVIFYLFLTMYVFTELLKYHILNLEICSAAVLNHASLHSLEGQKVNLTCDINDLMRVNNIPVANGDIMATNGLIHVLDEILVPDSGLVSISS